MRASKLIAASLLIAGVYIFTRGSGWHVGYMAAGSVVGIVGAFLLALLMSGKTTRGGRVRKIAAASH